MIRTLGMTVRAAALSCGVPTSTLYDWLDDGPSGFRDRVAEAESVFMRRMLTGIVADAIELKSFKARAWLLERRFPDIFGEKAKLDLTVHQPDLEDRVAEAYPGDEVRERAHALAIEVLRREEAPTPATDAR